MTAKIRLIFTLTILPVFILLGKGVITAQTAQQDEMPRGVDLKEVVVKPKKEKYSKKNNPAVDFINRLRDRISVGDPYQSDYYSFTSYDQMIVGLNNIADTLGNGEVEIGRRFQFLKEYVDTSKITDKLYLPLTVREQVAENIYRRNPRSQKEHIRAVAHEGIDEMLEQSGVQVFLEDMFRKINLYESNLTVVGQRFVSPLSSLGPDFYKYYLRDTLQTDWEQLIEVEFSPRNSAMFGFTGKLYVVNDSAMTIRRAKLLLPRRANVNFVETLEIDQTYATDSATGKRLITDDILTAELSPFPGAGSLYAQRVSHYVGHSFDEPSQPERFDRVSPTFIAADAYIKDEDYWSEFRPEHTSRGAANMAHMVGAMRQVPLYYWSEQVLKVLVNGYLPTSPSAPVQFGPVNTFLSFNSMEGARFRLGGTTTAAFNNHWFLSGYGAYGTKDHRWKYDAAVEYSFRPKEKHANEFPVHSIRLSDRYDVDALGQRYGHTNGDNIFLSLKRQKDTLQVYRRQSYLTYTLELENNLSFKLKAGYESLDPSRYVNFRLHDGTRINHLRNGIISATVRFSPGEKFYQTRNRRYQINHDAPEFSLSHTYSPAGLLGAKYGINRTELRYAQRIWFSAFGYADVKVKGGHVWGTSAYPELLIANANLSYTIQPESFMLLNQMEFVTDSYAAFFVDYNLNGLILNQIPYVQKLKWREIVGVRGFWGKLSDKNDPRINGALPLFPAGVEPQPMHGTPYLELGVGLDNVFRILKIEYVQRLTYRHTPGVDRNGVRVALHFSF